VFPPVEPFSSGMLTVEDGNQLYWEVSGNPAGKPAVHLNGGPGAGTRSGYRRRFDPDRYLVVGFDQRGCGRSRPLVTDDLGTLSRNTTQALVADLESLRQHLGIDRWLLAGVSWGTTLAIAYAQAHPQRVSEMVLAAVALTTPDYVDWITEGVGALFPQAWEKFEAASGRRPGQRLVDAYHQLLLHPEPDVRARAALDWAAWEDAHISLDPHWRPAPPEDDPTRWQVMATLVTHYWSHAGFLPPEVLVGDLGRLSAIPTTIVHGRYDVSGPIGHAWALHRALPGSTFIEIEDEGHGGPQMMAAVAGATTAFARNLSSPASG